MGWQHRKLRTQRYKARVKAEREAIDNEAVSLAYATSSTYAKRTYDREIALGVPAYTNGPGKLRWDTLVCKRPSCRNTFERKPTGGKHLYCSYYCEELDNTRRYLARHGRPYLHTKRRDIIMRVIRERNANA